MSDQLGDVAFREGVRVVVIDLPHGMGLRIEYERGERHKRTHGVGVEIIALDHEQARIIGRQLLQA